MEWDAIAPPQPGWFGRQSGATGETSGDSEASVPSGDRMVPSQMWEERRSAAKDDRSSANLKSENGQGGSSATERGAADWASHANKEQASQHSWDDRW
jgi:hypothetical protein